MKFRELFVAFALIGIFMLAMVNFGINIARDNNSNDSIMQDATMNQTFENLEVELGESRASAETEREIFEKDAPKVGTGYFVLEAIIGGGKIFTGMITGVYNLILVPLSEIIGVPEVVIAVISAILLITMVLLAWRVYKAGD